MFPVIKRYSGSPGNRSLNWKFPENVPEDVAKASFPRRSPLLRRERNPNAVYEVGLSLTTWDCVSGTTELVSETDKSKSDLLTEFDLREYLDGTIPQVPGRFKASVRLAVVGSDNVGWTAVMFMEATSSRTKLKQLPRDWDDAAHQWMQLREQASRLEEFGSIREHLIGKVSYDWSCVTNWLGHYARDLKLVRRIYLLYVHIFHQVDHLTQSGTLLSQYQKTLIVS